MDKEINQLSLKEINLDEVDAKGFVNQNRLDDVKKLIREIKVIVEEMIDIKDRNPDLHPSLIGKINSYENWVKTSVIRLAEEVVGDNNDITRKKEQYLAQIENYHAKVFTLDGPNQIPILDHFSIIKSFDREPVINVVKEKQMLNNLLTDISKEKSKIGDYKNESEIILGELKKKVQDQTVSDYAIVFQKEVVKYRKDSIAWLISGIAITCIFIAGFICINAYDVFPTEAKFLNENNVELISGYNISNIIIKVILIAIFIFLISFSFKQYNINKHQQTLNLHRQNALNSYKLFTESIIGEDSNSRNALMVQVAKAIYEHTQSTGFLNDKGQTMNSGIVELTKIIGENKS